MRSVHLGLVAGLSLSACTPGTPELAQSSEAAGPGQSTWQAQTIAGMSTRLYVPAGAAPSGGRGLMVVLHGCSQQATAIGDSGNWGDTADRYQWVVAAPSVPGGGVIAGCWDYYGTSQSRTSKYNDDVLALVQALLSRGDLAIDPNQVYVSGLSSGASQAMVLGCLAPDVFAGVGINAGPTVGTTSGQIGSVATSQSAAVSLCRSWAGSHSGDFATQLTSIVHGDNDYTVAVGYNALNAKVMAEIYGASGPTTFSTAGLPGANPAGSGEQFSDAQGPRVRRIQNTGLGHNWPSGAGGGQSAAFVNPNSIDYPEELASFFSTHNRRISGDRPPTLTLERTAAVGATVEVDGLATDDNGAPSVRVEVLDGPTAVAPFTPSLASDGRFSIATGALADGTYRVRAQATDGAGQVTVREASVSVGLPPPPPPGVTATLTEHINAGRLAWADYGTYYLRYGTSPFTLYQQADGSWSDVPPSGGVPDAGFPDTGVPVVDAGFPDSGLAPDAGFPDSGVAPDAGFADAGFPSTCQEFTSSNYQHVVAGRATVCSFAYACAVGSGERLGLYNTFYTATLAETSPGYFLLGSCP
ncbi:MAG: PHB depolymerase family esterase [Myxococcales bacterium]|nr:PHB depolymerase family esterase [Myxococcales bacterium]